MYLNHPYKKSVLKAVLCLLVWVFALNINVLAKDSELSTGTWYKLSITSTGIYKLTYSDLEAMGIDVAHINPKNIRMFHNGGGVLPTLNKSPYPDDLAEIPIFVQGETDEVFNKTDYILFYARGPVTWSYNAALDYYTHKPNPYTDQTYAFLTVGETPGKRIQYDEAPTGTAISVNEMVDYRLKDYDETNLNNMGCTWYGDKFDVTLRRDYEFAFGNLNTSRNVKMRASVASRNVTASAFYFRYNNRVIYTASMPGNTDHLIYARVDTMCRANFTPTSNNVTISLTYTRNQTSSVGWIDYISVNAWRYLTLNGDMMKFRNPECSDSLKVYEYQVRNASSSIKIWDVTNPVEPTMKNTTYASSVMSFKVRGNVKNEFVAFNGNSFNKATYVGKVSNQNLHALKDIDYLIVTHPRFKSQAERLKSIHASLDDLTIEVVQPQTIYNEFSCGAQDPAGIRALIRMLYNNSSAEHRLKYVLLFGDASYDMKNPELCFIPSWESRNGWSLVTSIVTDDFYVSLGDDEGNMDSDVSMIDLAVGRMPVSTEAGAKNVVDKIVKYVSRNDNTMGNWRNVVTLICDDESSDFITNSETLADSMSRWGGDVIVDKIYLDAYNQIATASGQRCPEMNEAITNRIIRGSLVVNYNGHGGEIGWADERILTIDNINTWDNAPMFPLFVTATCEFSRFDDHTRTSAGEMVFTRRNGGAIAMITTARTTSSSGPLLKRTYRNMFKMKNGEYPTMGDIYLKAKQDKMKSTKVFVLFGDPALRLAYPKNNVVLTKINGKPAAPVYDTVATNDTLKALGTIELQGEVRDNFGEVMTDFNGIVSVSVYDKENTYRTKGDNGYASYEFKQRNSLLFEGKAEVDSGRFTIRFVLPKDINYSYGKGLISFYATDYVTDANGCYDNIVVGGYNDEAVPDEHGPKAKVFIDDTLFVSGGITNENPVFYAFIKDENGINMAGAGIGHDIMVTLTGATNKMYNLNMYYDTPVEANDYGTIVYHFYGLNEGDHHLKFKVWDIYNNSTTVYLDFKVVKSSAITVENLCNAPNPMKSYTNFMFEHNQKGNIDIVISIYNTRGELVKTIKDSRRGTSTRIDPIYWDGTSDGGAVLPSGLYIYNVVVSGDNGKRVTDHAKLIISR